VSARLDVGAFSARLRLGTGPFSGIEALDAVWPLSPDRLAVALSDAGVLVDDDQAVEVWLVLDEQLAERAYRRQVAHDTGGAILDAGTMAAIEDGAGLILDAGLPDLPLLALAAEVAETLPQRRLSVRLVPGGMGIAAGCFAAREAVGGLILVDQDLPADEVCQRVWPHELGHALDGEMSRVSTAGAEAFADRLAPLLLEHQPATLTATQPLIEQSLEATRAVRRPAPPPRCGLGELLEWCLCQSVGREPAPELIAAYRGRPVTVAGVNRQEGT